MSDLGAFVAQGSVFAVEATEPLATELQRCLGDLRAPEDGQSSAHSLTVCFVNSKWTVTWDGHPRYRGTDAHMALYDALIAINVHSARIAVEAGRTVLHGGAVGIKGGAVAFVGHSGAGKSTFTAAMTRADHSYLADEVVSISDTDVDMMVESFHRPIGLRAGGVEMLGVDVPDGPYDTIYPYRVGGRGVLGEQTPLRLILLLKRADSGPARIEPVSPARALFELANQTLGATDLEREMFQRLDTLVRRIPIAELQYSNLTDAIPTVERVAAKHND